MKMNKMLMGGFISHTDTYVKKNDDILHRLYKVKKSRNHFLSVFG